MKRIVKGRFAPSPSGRMHFGNVFAALISWLSAKSAGGSWLLRIEDLDPQRSKEEYARLIEDDLQWLGLEWDEGGLAGIGPSAPYRQSMRHDIYERTLGILADKGLLYTCRCTRADLHASQAPHASDGRMVYSGRCRPEAAPPFPSGDFGKGATRLFVPDMDICFTDRLFGDLSVNLAGEFGDFIVRRADGAWAYQLAVVADDAEMGVTEVVRGCDLLFSSAPQIYLYGLIGKTPPDFGHVPIIVNKEGRRLSKRDSSMSMEELRRRFSAEEIIGKAAFLAGLQPEPAPRKAHSLIEDFSWSKIPATESVEVIV